MSVLSFSNLIKSKTPIHMIGIGGVSMSSIARALKYKGAQVSGSDSTASDMTELLAREGIPVTIGHSEDNVPEGAFVIYTAAIHPDNAERQQAAKKGLVSVERAVALGSLMSEYPSVICVAGTHGKSSTSGMLAAMAMCLELDPTFMIGAALPGLDSGFRRGDSGLFIAEACEYFNSFLHFSADVAVILNVEHDHVDFFATFADYRESFRKFIAGLRPGGTVCVNADAAGALQCAAGSACNCLTFGLQAGELRALDIKSEPDGMRFCVQYRDMRVDNVRLRAFGKHNVYNALGAMAALLSLGYPLESIAAALGAYTGLHRRMEFLGLLAPDIPVFDDYAHHPSEIAVSLAAVRDMGCRRIICAFQPHTYSRTAGLLDEFAAALREVDVLFLADIYAAREQNTLGISSGDLACRIEGAQHVSEFAQIAQRIRATAQPGDIVITMGAGDIYKIAQLILPPQ